MGTHSSQRKRRRRGLVLMLTGLAVGLVAAVVVLSIGGRLGEPGGLDGQAHPLPERIRLRPGRQRQRFGLPRDCRPPNGLLRSRGISIRHGGELQGSTGLWQLALTSSWCAHQCQRERRWPA